MLTLHKCLGLSLLQNFKQLIFRKFLIFWHHSFQRVFVPGNHFFLWYVCIMLEIEFLEMILILEVNKILDDIFSLFKTSFKGFTCRNSLIWESLTQRPYFRCLYVLFIGFVYDMIKDSIFLVASIEFGFLFNFEIFQLLRIAFGTAKPFANFTLCEVVLFFEIGLGRE